MGDFNGGVLDIVVHGEVIDVVLGTYGSSVTQDGGSCASKSNGW